MNVFIGSVALSEYYGCVSPVYYMLHTRYEHDCIRYYNYLFQTQELQKKLHGKWSSSNKNVVRVLKGSKNQVRLLGTGKGNAVVKAKIGKKVLKVKVTVYGENGDARGTAGYSDNGNKLYVLGIFELAAKNLNGSDLNLSDGTKMFKIVTGENITGYQLFSTSGNITFSDVALETESAISFAATITNGANGTIGLKNTKGDIVASVNIK